MTKKSHVTFVSLALATVLMPWLILLTGRVVLMFCLFWLFVLSLLSGSIVMLWKSRILAIVGFIALLLTLLSMIIVPSFARGE